MSEFTVNSKEEVDKLVRGHYAVLKADEVALTPAQVTEWDTTRAVLSHRCPAFTHIFYTMLAQAGHKTIAIFTRRIGTAATDGRNLIINPDFFFGELKSTDERIFVVAHEILHCVFQHCKLLHKHVKDGYVRLANGKTLPLEPRLLNCAQDYIINDVLVVGKVGKKPAMVLHDTSIATEKDDHISVYEKLLRKRPPVKPLDLLILPGQSDDTPTNEAVEEMSDRSMQQAVAAGYALAKQMGKLPANLEAIFGVVMEPKVDWTDKLRAFFARNVGGAASNWRTPDRRMIVRDIWVPSRKGNGAGTIVVGFDTSGSIYADKGTLDRFISEVGGILSDLRPKELHIVWCDAAVHHVDTVDEMTELQNLRPVGGGGTAFEPVFDWIDANVNADELDGLIYLTDGYGSFPAKAPPYPVLWGSIACQPKEYPFGEVVMVPRGD